MKKYFIIFLLSNISLCVFTSCEKKSELSSLSPVDWSKRKAKTTDRDSLDSGSTYLSVYSQIYSSTEHEICNLTATISMRNTSMTDTIFIEKANYFDTKGTFIRSYFNHPIYLAPLETEEIVINQTDKAGGTGGNFIFDWKIKSNTCEPIFEAVMISIAGPQGLSFSTTGKKITK